MMSDYEEKKEKNAEVYRETKSERLTPSGMTAIQGEFDTDSSSDDQPDASPYRNEEITIHPNPKGPEYLPSPETEPKSVPAKEGRIKGQEQESPEPPEGFRPGGVEGGS